MTPKLLALARSTDESVAEDAASRWQAASTRYLRHLREVRHALPVAARKLLQPQLNLHDARVLAMTSDDAPSFSLFLERPRPPHDSDRYLQLTYRLLDGARSSVRFLEHPALVGDGQPLHWWLYDELDVIDQRARRTFTHSILFTGGLELRLAFSGLRYRRLKVFLPSSTTSDHLDLLPK